MTMPSDDTPVAGPVANSSAANRMAPTIAAAAESTGVSFSYLMAQAGRESAFQAHAGSHASSAAGLFQFTKGTWLQLVKMHGAVHGLGDMASHIHRTAQGDYVVDNAKIRREILDLRRDPPTAALMAGEYAKDNKVWLEHALGRPVGSADLYLAHFLGPGGAAKLLKAKGADPEQVAAELLPKAAAKNLSVFYDANHSPSSVTEVYTRIKHAIERPMKTYAASQPDAVWPFETGSWPPAFVPASVSPTANATTASAEPAAFTSASASADRISAPMPPSPGGHETGTGESGGAFQQLWRSLFG
jgi:hypothetical protein